MNLTISVDEATVRRARIRALQENTSVNAVLGKYLEAYAGEAERLRRQQEAAQRMLAIARRSQSADTSDGGRWTRDELYGERLDRFCS